MAGNLLSDLTGYLTAPATETSPGAISAQYASPEASLGTLTWTGTTAPGGTITKLYYYQVLGPFCKVYWKIKASTPGLLVTAVSAPFPLDLPAPKQFSSQVNDSWMYLGDGAVLANPANLNSNGSGCGIYKDASGNILLRINSGTVAVAAGFAMASCSYLIA